MLLNNLRSQLPLLGKLSQGLPTSTHHNSLLNHRLGGVRWATHKASGASKNHGGSGGKRLGVKVMGGETINPNEIIVRQRGLVVRPGDNVFRGNDHTLHASIRGVVEFEWDPIRKRKIVHVRQKEEDIGIMKTLQNAINVGGMIRKNFKSYPKDLILISLNS